MSIKNDNRVTELQSYNKNSENNTEGNRDFEYQDLLYWATHITGEQCSHPKPCVMTDEIDNALFILQHQTGQLIQIIGHRGLGKTTALQILHHKLSGSLLTTYLSKEEFLAKLQNVYELSDSRSGIKSVSAVILDLYRSAAKMRERCGI